MRKAFVSALLMSVLAQTGWASESSDFESNTKPAITAEPAWTGPEQEPKQIPIWPENEDLSSTRDAELAKKSDFVIAGKPITIVSKVSKPTITVYPAQGKNSGAAIVVFPGGGYSVLAIDIEGSEACQWLSSKGITCILLKYRVPGEGEGIEPRSGPFPKSLLALQDAQRTLGLVRMHAADWRIDPHKIGVLGFSAGGNLAAMISTHFEKRLYPLIDAADKFSCRPDFTMAIYPAYLQETNNPSSSLSRYIPISRQTPPTFILHAEDDSVIGVQNSLTYYAALKKAEVPAEIHIYEKGNHGFGTRRTELGLSRA